MMAEALNLLILGVSIIATQLITTRSTRRIILHTSAETQRVIREVISHTSAETQKVLKRILRLQENIHQLQESMYQLLQGTHQLLQGTHQLQLDMATCLRKIDLGMRANALMHGWQRVDGISPEEAERLPEPKLYDGKLRVCYYRPPS
ncbi:MAG: hypothetical protein QXR87_02790 [Candidatus Hadarchaeales archaeon]